MATQLKRMTCTVTPNITGLMNEAKQMFFGGTQSDMIRTLVVADRTALKAKKVVKETKCDTS
jgi:hypothetical protein